jgi:predicted DCC family thiol-disulfide oxidoreductase YuxK
MKQQTATSEVLRIISNSPTEIQPVLDAVAENAGRLCDANDAVIFLSQQTTASTRWAAGTQSARAIAPRLRRRCYARVPP